MWRSLYAPRALRGRPRPWSACPSAARATATATALSSVSCTIACSTTPPVTSRCPGGRAATRSRRRCCSVVATAVGRHRKPTSPPVAVAAKSKSEHCI
eukprot:scaffold10056_cov69-Phaeocystis_antarctica.AAC.4